MSPHISRPVTDPIQFIEEDHQKVADLFEEIDSLSEDSLSAKRSVFALLDEALTDHAEMEEELLYPVLENLEETHNLTMESLEEHQVVKNLLDELSTLDIQSDDWNAKCTVLKENVQHHVDEEESELLPQASKILSKEELQALADQIEDWLTKRER